MEHFARLPEACVAEIISFTSPEDAARSSLERFFVDKRSGKKCYMLGATQIISWGDSTSLQMEWTSPSDSRFSEVAHITSAIFLDIRAKIQTQMLSPATTYAAYLVFRVATRYHGLEAAKATVRFVRDESDSEAEAKASVVHLKSRAYPNYDPMFLRGKIPRWRDDKWMEIEIGEFLTTKGDCNGDEVEARLFDNRQFYAKCGLIVDGVEFRPK